MNRTVNFTKAQIENLPLPTQGKRTYYKDQQLKGLFLAVQSTGSKSFYIYKKIHGKPERVLIGSYPNLTIENARKLAMIKLGKIAEGHNPQEELRKARSELTLGQLFDQYMNRYSKVHKKSWKYDEREIPKFLSHWFKRKLKDIKKTEIRLLHETVYTENGLYQANRVLERIRALYNKAIEWGWEGTNPTNGIKKYKEKSRDRFIQPHEMPHILRAINDEKNDTIKDLIWLLLLTGARKTNTLMMRWEQLSWERREWRIPDSKNGEPVVLPLSEKACELLMRRKQHVKSLWVFPQERDFDKHIVNIKRGWRRILENASVLYWKTDENLFEDINRIENELYHFKLDGSFYKKFLKRIKLENIQLPVAFTDIRIHDIRRTFGSYQAITGASLQVIGKSLGHKSIQSTQIYARLNLDPVRAAVERATNAIFNL